MGNYLMQFCPQLGSVAAPLSELQGVTRHRKWTQMYDVALEDVKGLIISNEVRKPLNPDPSHRIYLVRDLSDTEIIALIAQK